MRLGISSYTYGWAVGTDGNRPADALTPSDLIDRATQLGVRAVQLCDNLPDSTFEEDSIDRLAARAAAAGVSLELGARGCTPGHVLRLCRLARRIGSPVLRLVLDTPDDRPSEDEVVRRLRTVTGDFARAGVMLAV